MDNKNENNPTENFSSGGGSELDSDPILSKALAGVVAKTQKRYRQWKIIAGSTSLLGIIALGATFVTIDSSPTSSIQSKTSAIYPPSVNAPTKGGSTSGIRPGGAGAIPAITSMLKPNFSRETNAQITINYYSADANSRTIYPLPVQCGPAYPQNYGNSAPSSTPLGAPQSNITTTTTSTSGAAQGTSGTVQGSITSNTVSTSQSSLAQPPVTASTSGTLTTIPRIYPCLPPMRIAPNFNSIQVNVIVQDSTSQLFYAGQTQGSVTQDQSQLLGVMLGTFWTKSQSQVLVAAIPNLSLNDTVELVSPSGAILDSANASNFTSQSMTSPSPWIIVAAVLPNSPTGVCGIPTGFSIAVQNSATGGVVSYLMPGLDVAGTLNSCTAISFSGSSLTSADGITGSNSNTASTTSTVVASSAISTSSSSATG